MTIIVILTIFPAMGSTYISFLTKPYIAQWVHNKFGNPAILPQADPIRKILHLVIDKKYYKHNNIDTGTYTAIVNIANCNSSNEKNGSNIPKENLSEINNLIEDILKKELHSTILSLRIKESLNISKAIYRYQERFGFNEETYSFAAIRQAYYREDKKIFFQTTSQIQ